MSLLAPLTELLFPPTCVACAKVLPAKAFFCADCELLVDRLPSPGCARCAEPGSHPAGLCGRCRVAPPPFARAGAPFVHAGAIARAIQAFKYEDHPELARPLGALLASEARAFLLDAPAAVCAVPLHRSRFLSRKYDQAALLARELATATGRPCLELLSRARATERQVGLTEEARARNVDGAFLCAAPPPREVLLLDDVLTTSATARAAAAALLSAGAQRVEVLTLARAYSG